MNVTKVDTLRVPGASLYYEVRGSGPVLLMIGAGAADAASFNGIATYLADQYTVLSYDRRGYSRSSLDDPEEEQRIEMHSDDAHRLLAQLCTEPAYVFGSGVSQPSCWLCESPESIRRAVARRSDSGDKTGSRKVKKENEKGNTCARTVLVSQVTGT